MPTPSSDSPGPYQAAALQIATHSVGHLRDRTAARALIRANIDRTATHVDACARQALDEGGLPLGLLVLPEYSLTGAPPPISAAEWRHLAALEPDGSEYEALGAIAARAKLYLAGNAYEADPHFPDLYFQASFIIGPDGAVILRYRRLISLYSPSPYDVLARYLDVHGPGSLFPVADTPIGRLAAVASEEILYPEIARCHVLRGAEVLVHSTSEMGSPRPTGKELARRARAAENLCYLVSANTAEVPATSLPGGSSTGMSKIVDYEGRVLSEAAPGGSGVAAAVIDPGKLRARRRQAGLANTLVRLPLQAWAHAYAATAFRGPDGLAAAGGEVSRATLNRMQAETIERLDRAGLI